MKNEKNVFDTVLQVSSNCVAQDIKLISFGDLIEQIKTSKPLHQHEAIELLLSGDESTFQKIKTFQTPVVRFNALVREGNKETENIQSYTGLIYYDLDYDKNPNMDLKKIVQDVMLRLPYLVCAYDSFSGRGIGLVAFGGAWINSEESFKEFYSLIKSEILRLYPTLDFCSVDSGVRPAAISYDPEMIVNWKVKPFAIVNKEKPFKKSVTHLLGSTGKRVDAGERKYCTQIMADIHLNEWMRENEAQTVQFDEYVLSTSAYSKVPMVKMFGRKNKIEDGERNTLLNRDYSYYVFLNGPVKSDGELMTWLKHYNEYWCKTPLQEKEIMCLGNKIVKKYREGKLKVKSVSVNGAFTSNCKANKEGRCGVSAKGKRIRNIFLFINKIAEDSFYLAPVEMKSMTCEDWAVFLKMALKTVKQYSNVIFSCLHPNSKTENRQSLPDSISNKIYLLIKEKGLHHLVIFGGSVQNRIEVSVLQLVQEQKEVCQKAVVVLSGASKRSVERYWTVNGVKSKYLEHNKRVKELDEGLRVGTGSGEKPAYIQLETILIASGVTYCHNLVLKPV